MKRCSGCKENRPLSDYYKCASSPDGLQWTCRQCMRVAVAESRRRNPTMYARQKRDNAAAARTRRLADPATARAAERERYARIPAARKRASRVNYQRHRESYIRRTRVRRANLVVVPGAEEYAALVRRDPCSYCSGDGGTVDHIMPVSGGGRHEFENLTGACLRCNVSKHAKPVLEFMLRERGVAA